MENNISEIMTKTAEIAYKIKNTPDVLNEENYDIPLTGSSLGFDAMDMCYLTFELLSCYNVTLNARDLEGRRFNSIHSIAECISSKMSQAQS